jgi:hypothetical protein
VALRELGMLPPDVIQQTLREQIEDVIRDLFLWQRGIFYFQSEMPQEEEILPEPINVVGLVMEGTRWVDEVARFRRVLVHDGVVLRRGEKWPGGKNLLPDRALDVEEVRETAETGTQEMSVYDLLLEQATEEQVLVARRHMAVPLDLLERCYPVWVEEPAEDEQTRMPVKARDFYARFDGRTSLGNAFSGDARIRGREMDLLLLQLQKGRLALLPAPVDSLEAAAERRGQPALQRWWRRVFQQAS